MVNKIKENRVRLGFTLQTLADLVGTSKSYIWDLEAQKSVPGIELAYAIARALRRDVRDIFPEETE